MAMVCLILVPLAMQSILTFTITSIVFGLLAVETVATTLILVRPANKRLPVQFTTPSVLLILGVVFYFRQHRKPHFNHLSGYKKRAKGQIQPVYEMDNG